MQAKRRRAVAVGGRFLRMKECTYCMGDGCGTCDGRGYMVSTIHSRQKLYCRDLRP